jgi:hypothetical protein
MPAPLSLVSTINSAIVVSPFPVGAKEIGVNRAAYQPFAKITVGVFSIALDIMLAILTAYQFTDIFAHPIFNSLFVRFSKSLFLDIFSIFVYIICFHFGFPLFFPRWSNNPYQIQECIAHTHSNIVLQRNACNPYILQQAQHRLLVARL